MTPITIESLTIEGFRAYLERQSFSFARRKTPLSLAVFAPNAKGKSSLVDAFEFFFSEESTLSRLGRRAAQKNAGPLAMVHVDVESRAVTPRVEFVFRCGEETFRDERIVQTTETPLPAASERVLSQTSLPFVIHGYELRRFVEDTTPEDRYGQVVSWFGFNPVLKIQKNLRDLRSKVKQSAESNAEIAERDRDLRKLTQGSVNSWDTERVLTWVNDEVLAKLDETLQMQEISAEDDVFPVLTDRKQLEEDRIGITFLDKIVTAARKLFSPRDDTGEGPTGMLVQIDNAINERRDAIAGEEEERSRASEAIFKEVWEAAKDLLENEELEVQTCPVCETPFQASPNGSRDGVSAFLDDKLSALAQYHKAVTRVEKANTGLKNTRLSFKHSVMALNELVKGTDYEADIRPLTEYLRSIDADMDPKVVPESSNARYCVLSLTDKAVEAKDEIERAIGTVSYAGVVDTLNRVLEIKSDVERIQGTKTELNRLREALDGQTLELNRAISLHMQELVGRLQEGVESLYGDIQGSDETAPRIRLELPNENDKNQKRLQLLVDFARNRRGVVPSGYLSDSQIHTLALALRLSAIKFFNRGFPVIVLDDVVTSYDADHRKNISAALAKHFPDHQYLITTHDEQFFALLKDHLPQNKWTFKRITRLDDGFGPVFHDHMTPDEIIEEKLEAGEDAANEIRQAEEEWLLRICRDFAVKVEIRPVSKPYEFERAELAGALASYLKEAKILPPIVSGVSNPFLSTLQRGSVENFGSHFSDNPYKQASVGDSKRRWLEFKEFRDQFVCPSCGNPRFKRPRDLKKPVCAKCETTFSFRESQQNVGG